MLVALHLAFILLNAENESKPGVSMAARSRKRSGERAPLLSSKRAPKRLALADVDVDDPDAIRAYLLAGHSAAQRHWSTDPVKLNYNDPRNLLRARVYQLGCMLLRKEKADQLIAVLTNARIGRGRSHANVFSAILSLLPGERLPPGFTPSACRKAAAVMQAAYFYKIHPRYVTLFAIAMKGWSTPVDSSQLAKTPVWMRGLSREVQSR